MSSSPPLVYEGARAFRSRVILSTLSGRRVLLRDIRSRDESPGLRDHEASMLRLLDKLTNGCGIEINETGTRLRYTPGLIAGGTVEHDCGTARAIGWFLEALLLLAPFSKKPFNVTLRGVTNDDVDVTVDTIKADFLPALAQFGVEGADVVVVRRGCAPAGGGEIRFTCPVIRELRAANIVEEGFVKRVRGVAFACRISPQMANRMVDGVRCVRTPLLNCARAHRA
jgi:RNA 3'-terminal phosphate cyclase-like protein